MQKYKISFLFLKNVNNKTVTNPYREIKTIKWYKAIYHRKITKDIKSELNWLLQMPSRWSILGL